MHFRPAFFEPTFHKHAKTLCGGCQIHVTDRRHVRAGASGGRAARRVPARGAVQPLWREPPYEYEHDEAADRHPLRIRSAAAWRSTPARMPAPIAADWARDEDGVPGAAAAVPALLIAPWSPEIQPARRHRVYFFRTRARDADLIRVLVRVRRVDPQPRVEAEAADLGVRAFAQPLGFA